MCIARIQQMGDGTLWSISATRCQGNPARRYVVQAPERGRSNAEHAARRLALPGCENVQLEVKLKEVDEPSFFVVPK